MNDYFDFKQIETLFDTINKSRANYMLLRNINDALPYKLPKNQDIDIIVKKNNLGQLHASLISEGWKQIAHPIRKIPFLYAMTPFRFYNKNGLHLDVCCELSCRSLNKGEWFPLDQTIQNEIWINKLKTKNLPWAFTLSMEDELIHLVTRSVFDKKEFTEGYVNRINHLMDVVSIDTMEYKFSLIFFKFTSKLIVLLRTKQYDNIVSLYTTFKDY